MTEFLRFPCTPHLAWLAHEGMPRDYKVFSPNKAQALLDWRKRTIVWNQMDWTYAEAH